MRMKIISQNNVQEVARRRRVAQPMCRVVGLMAAADRLTGHLLIIYAEMDENALPNQALRLVDALTRANKPYDLIDLQNRNHFAGATDGYTIKRTWDYFVEHLRGAAPVSDYKVETRPIIPD